MTTVFDMANGITQKSPLVLKLLKRAIADGQRRRS
jgi:hypothetical protein